MSHSPGSRHLVFDAYESQFTGLEPRLKQIAVMQKATGSPVLIGPSGMLKLERIKLGSGTHSESWLQALIFDHPEILPVTQIEPAFGVPLPAAREVACGHGTIDNLYLTPDGEIILVETKLWRNAQTKGPG